jgi:hypothetical protein
MTQWLAIAAYRCEVAGEGTDSIDFQVRYFTCEHEYQVEELLRAEPVSSYLNDNNEQVSWPLAHILAIQELPSLNHGDELIGFIAQSSEIPEWTHPSA